MPFTKCTNRINNTDIDNAKDSGIVMLMYNLVKYRDNYGKTHQEFYINNTKMNQIIT